MIHIPVGVRYDKVEVQAELDVSAAYFISVPDGWQHKERFLDLAELIYITEGELHLSVGGEAVSLTAGDAYLVRKYTTLSGVRPSVGACAFYTVSFYCTLAKYDTLYGKALRISSRSSHAQTLFNDLTFYASKGTGESYLVDSAFSLLLEVLYDSCTRESERVQMHGILRYINDHIASPLTVDQISEQFHYSNDYISKIFREQLGVTIKQYVIQRKLSVAKRLLTTSDISIKQVGQAVGFHEPMLFDKFFKYHVKMTPKKYRELYL
ncbi:MAG: helix-turn-helix domain-containing protein [Clostridia bacterium]|nr:helix-turn-helix domain-containing protein [Clostridia bacterium]